jgi:hypothetical protein
MLARVPDVDSTHGNLGQREGCDRSDDRGKRCGHGDRDLGLTQATHEELTPREHEAGVRRVPGVAMRAQGCDRLDERLGGREVAHRESDLGGRGHAAGGGKGALAVEQTKRASEELSRGGKVAKLGERDPAQRDGVGVLVEGHELEGGERVAGGEQATCAAVSR